MQEIEANEKRRCELQAMIDDAISSNGNKTYLRVLSQYRLLVNTYYNFYSFSLIPTKKIYQLSSFLSTTRCTMFFAFFLFMLPLIGLLPLYWQAQWEQNNYAENRLS